MVIKFIKSLLRFHLSRISEGVYQYKTTEKKRRQTRQRRHLSCCCDVYERITYSQLAMVMFYYYYVLLNTIRCTTELGSYYLWVRTSPSGSGAPPSFSTYVCLLGSDLVESCLLHTVSLVFKNTGSVFQYFILFVWSHSNAGCGGTTSTVV